MSEAAKKAPMESATQHYAWNEDTKKRQAELDALGVSIKPVPLTSSSAAAPPSGATSPLGSAWNTAGTWEERDVTRSATSALESRLAAFVSSPRSGKRVHMATASVSGSVTLIASRGKLRVGYELALSATWEIREEGGGGEALARGSLKSTLEDSDSDIFSAFSPSKTEGSLPTGEAVSLVKLTEDALRKEVKAWVEDTKKV